MGSKVIVIGGGLSGSLLAMQLARSKGGSEVILIEKKPEYLGRGVAYQYDFTHQPLNVVAGGMSLFPEKPLDFVRWLEANHFRYNHLINQVSPEAFVPRKIFGDYVLENLEKTQQEVSERLQIRIDEAISIMDFGKRKTVVFASGNALHVDHVILALGNFTPADLFAPHSLVQNDPRYNASPWSDKVYSDIKGAEDILLVGSGLTAVDIVLGLAVRQFKGKVTMLSRRGVFPLPHDLTYSAMPISMPQHYSPRKMLLWVRRFIRKNTEIPWPVIMDGLRPYTQKIWLHWSITEKQYFLRKIRPYWEIARHRIPFASSEQLMSMMERGQLTLKKGSVEEAKLSSNGIEIIYRSEKGLSSGVFQKVINCTGPESNYRKVRFPIIVDLIARGKVKTDELGLGIKCTPEGRIINAQDEVEQGIWCIGPMRKAVLWETTALRELREQAFELATLIDQG